MAKSKAVTNKHMIYAGVAVVVLVALLGIGYMFQLSYEATAALAVTIEPIDFSSIHEGHYIGEYRLGLTKYKVEVEVHNRRITGVEIIRNRSNRYARMAAEGIIERVVARGNVSVDTVSGATTSSIGILKAIEQALKHAPACPT
ncbi:MAG: FMN-binding protein [Selenomonadales bacterium]|nr:FMN-binding protein [Selenomonadales bacterium]